MLIQSEGGLGNMERSGKPRSVHGRGGIDSRVLRAHRRSVDWKNVRDEEVTKRRNISDDLTPVKETEPSVKPEKDDRREKLAKWKKEKELKRNLEKNKKRNEFKVCHVNVGEYDFIKPLAVKAQKPEKAPSASACVRRPVTRASTRVPQPTKRVPLAKPTQKEHIPPRTRAQDRHQIQKSGNKGHTVSSVGTRSQTAASTTRKSKTQPKGLPEVPEIKSRRTTRQTSAAKDAWPVNEKNVTTNRGEKVLGYSSSGEFSFSSSLQLRPLSPTSADTFFSGACFSPIVKKEDKRCSTPKSNQATMMVAPVVSAIPGRKTSSENNDSDANGIESDDQNPPAMMLEQGLRSQRSNTGGTKLWKKSDKSSDDTTDDEQQSRAGSRRRKSQVVTATSTKEQEDIEMGDAKKMEVKEQETVVLTENPTADLSSKDKHNDEPSTRSLEPDVPAEKDVAGMTEEADKVSTFSDVWNKSAPGDLDPIEEHGTFRTPRSVTRAARRRTVSMVMALTGSHKKTPKALRNSLIMRHLSPEEGVEVLKHSPMIEMGRRSKSSHSPGGSSVPQMPSFDDMEEELLLSGASSSASSGSGEVKKVSFTDEAQPTRDVEEAKPGETSDTDSVFSNPETAKPDREPVVEESQVDPAKQADQDPEEHNVPYFRQLIVSETDKLRLLCKNWEEITQGNILTDEVEGEIRTSIGKAQLLISQRFKQFSGLIDNCEFNTGEKETTYQDLQGFWDMIYCQVQDIEAKFQALDKLQGNNWVSDEPKVVKKKILKKRPVTKVTGKAGGVPARSRFLEFRAKMKQAQEQPTDDKVEEPEGKTKTFEGGFFCVASPVRSPKPHCEGGTPSKLQPGSLSSNTPVETPLFRSVLEKSARRSGSIIKGSFKSASAEKFTPKSSSQRQFVSSRRSLGISSYAKVEGATETSEDAIPIIEITVPSVETIIKESTDEESALQVSDQVAEPATTSSDGHSVGSTPHISDQVEEPATTSSDGNTPHEPEPCNMQSSANSRRRSTRASSISQTLSSEVEMEVEMDDTTNPFAKYLAPSNTDNLPAEEPTEMHLGSPPMEDIDMASRSKRGLVSEFNEHSSSARKRRQHQSAPGGRPSPFTPGTRRSMSASEQRHSLRRSTMSTRTRSRHSVHFSVESSPAKDLLSLKVPSTPFNRDSLVPQSRIVASAGKPEQKENRGLACDADTPTTSLAKLSMDPSPIRKTRNSVAPSQPATSGDDNLMSFSPVTIQAVNPPVERGTPVRRSRRQSRLSLL